MCWTRESVGLPKRFSLALDAPARGELAAAAKRLSAAGRVDTVHTTTRADFDLPALNRRIDRAVEDVKNGCGFALITGLPYEGLTKDEFTAATWIIGTRFGHALSQNAQGDLITEVIDATAADPTPRMYRSSLELRLHSDITAMIALACWQSAQSGGLSYLASAAAIHNEILARAPHLLEPLYNGFHYHRLGEEGPDEEPTTPYRTPVFALRAGQLSRRYQRAGIAAGHKGRGVPLTDLEMEALDLFDAVARVQPHGRQRHSAAGRTRVHLRFQGPVHGRPARLRRSAQARDRNLLSPRPAMQRRSLLKAGATFAALPLTTLPSAARAQGAWPARPVKLVVPFGAGGATDIIARLISQKLSELWGQSVVADQALRAGAICSDPATCVPALTTASFGACSNIASGTVAASKSTRSARQPGSRP
jgi:hypothetical protein